MTSPIIVDSRNYGGITVNYGDSNRIRITVTVTELENRYGKNKFIFYYSLSMH